MLNLLTTSHIFLVLCPSFPFFFSFCALVWIFSDDSSVSLLILFSAVSHLLLSLLNNNQYQGCKEQRTLFRVLGIAIRETQTQVKLKEDFREEKVAYKGKSHKVFKTVW